MIHGGSRYQDFPWLGGAVPEWINTMDLYDISGNLNYNFLRTANYPNDKVVYDFADKSGIMVYEDAPIVSGKDGSHENIENQIREMIRRDRNHPGILFWGLNGGRNNPDIAKFLKEEDTTRIISSYDGDNIHTGLPIKFSLKRLNPENSPASSIRGLYFGDLGEGFKAGTDYCTTEANKQNLLKKAGLFSGNICSWIYGDYGSSARYQNSPLENISPEGYVDMYRIPKYQYYLWQANYSDKPMVFIQPHFWQPGFLGQKKDITVNSNCETVQLFVNGKNKGVLTPCDSNYHSVTFRNILIEKDTLTVTGKRGGQNVTSRIIIAGEPARIVLTCPLKEITADRGSVAVITADIVDARGNHVYGATGSVKWSVTGPATLSGPSLYESDINSNNEMQGVWYINMPVANIIRGTGTSGKIVVKASAGGLLSGSLELISRPADQDNTVISEPVLSDAGRRSLAKIVLKPERLNETPREIQYIQDDFVSPANIAEGNTVNLRKWIYQKNQSIDTASIEFKTLMSVFVRYLKNNNGRIPSYDFNFNIEKYNNCRLITGYINNIKVPQPFRDGLRQYYSDKIIRQGEEKNAGDELNWMNWIPSGGTIVIYQPGAKQQNIKGVIITDKSDLSDLISMLYPSFTGYSAEGKERALNFTSKMNPYIKSNQVKGQSGGIANSIPEGTSYPAIPGQPILIPLLKFISE